MVQKISLPRGALAKIANELGVTPTAVSLVFHGKSTSARISAAIEQELARVKASKVKAELAPGEIEAGA